MKLIPLLFLLAVTTTTLGQSLSAPTVTATAKGPNQINLTWSAVANPGYGYLVEIQSSGDSRYSSYTEIAPVPSASGDAALLNTDPSCTYCFQPRSNGLPPWVTESHYRDPQDSTAAQWIQFGLKNNTTYNFRVRTYSGYTSPTYSDYSVPVSATTLNYALRYVNAATGNDSNGGTNSTTDAWLTIHKACSTLISGQMGIVVGGNYPADNCDTANAGSPGLGNKIVLAANPGDTVTITTVRSNFNSLLVDQSRWVIDGINAAALYLTGADGPKFTASFCVWTNSNWNNMNQSGPQVRGDHNLIQSVYSHDVGNITVDAGSTMYVLGQGTGSASFNILQYNHLTRGSHDTANELNDTADQIPERNQWKNNIMDGGWGLGWEIINSTTSLPVVHHSLFEGNVLFSQARLVPAWYKPGIEVGADNVTIRRNLFLNIEDHAVEVNSQRNSSSNGLYYNNTIASVNQRCFWIAGDVSGPYTNDIFVNNICIKSGTVVDPGTGSIASLFVTYATDSSWVIEYNNLLYYTGGVTPVPGQVIVFYGVSSGNIATADSSFPPFSHNSGLNVLPLFVDESAYDFHLLGGSPMINAGGTVADATWGTLSQTTLGMFNAGGAGAVKGSGKAKLNGKVKIGP